MFHLSRWTKKNMHYCTYVPKSCETRKKNKNLLCVTDARLVSFFSLGLKKRREPGSSETVGVAQWGSPSISSHVIANRNAHRTKKAAIQCAAAHKEGACPASCNKRFPPPSSFAMFSQPCRGYSPLPPSAAPKTERTNTNQKPNPTPTQSKTTVRYPVKPLFIGKRLPVARIERKLETLLVGVCSGGWSVQRCPGKRGAPPHGTTWRRTFGAGAAHNDREGADRPMGGTKNGDVTFPAEAGLFMSHAAYNSSPGGDSR